MKWSTFFTSSVGKKLVMALSGLFLISFLIVHVGINACIFADLSIFDPNDNGEMFNNAAHFMGSSYVIRIMEIGLFVGFFVHIIQGYMLEAKNRAARSKGYAVKMGSTGSKWYRKSMGLLGTLILLFLILHISQFWWSSRVSHEPSVYFEEEPYNMFNLMVDTFKGNLLVVIIYVLGCFSLAWHLLHGFQSAFKTLGLHNSRFINLAKGLGAGFSIVVPLIFALMPIAIYLGWVG